MRNVRLIAYDIASPKRWRKVYRLMLGHGDGVQLSVFRCELSEIELHRLKEEIWPILNLAEDRVMIVDLGPVEGRGDQCIEFWGNPRMEPSVRSATIL